MTPSNPRGRDVERDESRRRNGLKVLGDDWSKALCWPKMHIHSKTRRLG
jgi:hypothetical protein